MRDYLKSIFDFTTVKFIIIGVVNTIFGTALMFLMYNILGASYWVSSASNYFFGSILSFFLNKKYTFRNTDTIRKTLPRFVVNILICYLLAYGIARPLAAWTLSGMSQSIKDNVAMIIGMGLFTVTNYLGQRFYAFR